jgi:FKBP-type peptidyl-prolyl cis-trans isomerase FkpA
MEKRFIKSIFANNFKNHKMKFYITLLFAVLVFTSCSKDSSFEPQTEADILKYIEDNSLNATKTDSGLYYVINNEGTGTRPTSSSNVTVAYKGYLLDGTVFDESDSDGISFGLNRVIKGWIEGIQLFKEGGEGILLIPSNLGYGSSGNSSIPGGAVLVFDIKLLSVN